jgi:hypothetical protein
LRNIYTHTALIDKCAHHLGYGKVASLHYTCPLGRKQPSTNLTGNYN